MQLPIDKNGCALLDIELSHKYAYQTSKEIKLHMYICELIFITVFHWCRRKVTGVTNWSVLARLYFLSIKFAMTLDNSVFPFFGREVMHLDEFFLLIRVMLRNQMTDIVNDWFDMSYPLCLSLPLTTRGLVWL